MAAFLALHLDEPSLLPCLLAALPALEVGAGERSAGVGSFQGDDVLLRKRPLPQPAPAARLAQGLQSRAVLFGDGAPGGPAPRGFLEEMVQPLRFKRWLFALAGTLEALAGARGPLLAALPDHLRRSAQGDTAGEALFFTFLARLRTLGRMDDHSLEPDLAARVLAQAVGDAERALEQGGAALPPLAAVVTNGRVLGAVRRGAPLSTRTVKGLPTCARCEIGPASRPHDPTALAHRGLSAVLVAGGPPPEGFEPVAEGAVLSVGRDLQPKLLA